MDLLAARSSAPTRAKHLVGPRLTVVFFGIHGEMMNACHTLARVLPFARAEAKCLDAACAALGVLSHAMLVAPRAMCPKDRETIEDHARRVDRPVLWVDEDQSVDPVITGIELWATAALRLGQ